MTMTYRNIHKILGFIRIQSLIIFYEHLILCMKIRVTVKGVTLRTNLTVESDKLYESSYCQP